MFANVTLSLMGGFVTTIQLFCLTLVFALPLGLIISFGSMSRFTPLRALVMKVIGIPDLAFLFKKNYNGN